MAKQTKKVKFLFVVLMLIPLALFVAGICQTFSLKSKQNELNNLSTTLTQKQEELSKYNQMDDYMFDDDELSEEFKKEYHKHESDGYGEEGDIQIELK
ncbi:MAG: hypothetical protein E7378_02225 [Clostridiales bacterium]|nr:hypothetical protein [Clostridiales bacterium]